MEKPITNNITLQKQIKDNQTKQKPIFNNSNLIGDKIFASFINIKGEIVVSDEYNLAYKYS